MVKSESELKYECDYNVDEEIKHESPEADDCFNFNKKSKSQPSKESVKKLQAVSLKDQYIKTNGNETL